MDRQALGKFGEDYVAQYLSNLGWRVIARRWRSRHNDLDLVALDGGEVVFVEVKARSSTAFGYPEEAVGWAKARELRKTAWFFLCARGWEARPYRIDVVSLIVRPGQEPELRHFRSAVGE